MPPVSVKNLNMSIHIHLCNYNRSISRPTPVYGDVVKAPLYARNSIQESPRISIGSNLWVAIPIVVVIAAILSSNLLFLNYVHVFTAVLWTGTDIFMALLLVPVLRNVSLSTRKEVISRL